MFALAEFELTTTEPILLNLSQMASIQANEAGQGTLIRMIDGHTYNVKQSLNEIKYLLTPRQNQAPQLRGL